MTRPATRFALSSLAVSLLLVPSASAAVSLDVLRDRATGVEFVRLPGGAFAMGSEQGAKDERPVHPVRLPGFMIGRHELTQAQWRQVMGALPAGVSGCDDCPVTRVSWNDVQAYLRKVKDLTGFVYRLPTEAQWEYAATAGGREGVWPGCADEASLGECAWHLGNAEGRTHPVGRTRPNRFGLFDLAGNVQEWCYDRYEADFYAASPAESPVGPLLGEPYRVIRGGSFRSLAKNLRAAYRFSASPESDGKDIGFRLALEDEGAAAGFEPIASLTLDDPSPGPADGGEASAAKDGAGEVDALFGDLVRIPGGEFTMGRDDGSLEEKPSHTVRVGEYLLGAHEVTRGQWWAVMRGGPRPDTETRNLPVAGVSWNDVQEFLRRVKHATGRTLRLPTEAEWEYAAGGGAIHQAWSGTDAREMMGEHAWFTENSVGRLRPVGGRKPNLFGLYDMSGNAREWCADRYDEQYYWTSPAENPTGPESGPVRVLRGGSYRDTATGVRVTRRESADQYTAGDCNGFRLASDAAAP